MRRPIATAIWVLALFLVSAGASFAQSETIQIQSPQPVLQSANGTDRSHATPEQIAPRLARTNSAVRADILQSLNRIRVELASGSIPGLTFDTMTVTDDSTETGGISGLVRTADPTGIDSSAAWVLAVAMDLANNPDAWQATSTDPGGYYQFIGLHPGEYLLMAGAANAQSLFFRDSDSMQGAEPVPVSPGVLTDGIDFFLQPIATGSGTLTGTVVSGIDEAPLPEARVVAIPAHHRYQVYDAVSDASGQYQFSNLPSGDYTVMASKDGFLPLYFDNVRHEYEATRVAVVGGEETAGIDFTLPAAGSISGNVSDQDDNPIPNATVLVAAANNAPDSVYYNTTFWTQTDAEGNYVVSGLATGTYYIYAQAFNGWISVDEWYDDAQRIEDALAVAVEEGSVTTAIDFSLDLAIDTGSVTGRVTFADGSPAAGAIVQLDPYYWTPFDSTLVDPIPYDSLFFGYHFVRTDSDGNFAFDSVPVGEYAVSVDWWGNEYYPTVWYDQVYVRSSATPVAVELDQTTSGIDFVLSPANGVIDGRITDADGKPIAGANVFASPGDWYYPVDASGGWGYAHATTDQDGFYRISGLVDGSWYVSASACLFAQCAERWWPDARLFPDAEAVVVADGQSDPSEVNISLPLMQGTASVSGTVTNVDGQLLSGASVVLAMTSDALDPTIADTLNWYFELPTTTDSLGRFVFNNLPAGDYVSQASYWSNSGYATQWYDGVTSFDDATIIRVADGESRSDINFTLEFAPVFGSLAGQVALLTPSTDPADSLGSPIERAYVEVSAAYWDYLMSPFIMMPWFAVTDANGRFEMTDLPNGTYYVNAYAQGARLPLDADGTTGYRVDIRGGQQSWVNVWMNPTDDGDRTIAGTISSSAGDVPEIAVVLAMADDDPMRTYTAIMNEDGSYAFEGLAPGEYVLWSFAPYHATEYYDNVYDPSEAKRLSLTETLSISGINFELEPVLYLAEDDEGRANASVIYGRVADSHSKSLDGAMVYALDEAGTVVQSARTNANGMYELGGLAAGHGIRIKATRPGFASKFHDGATAFDASAEMMLSRGRFEVNFTLATDVSSGTDDPSSDLPQGISLSGNYPNPFAATTTISFSVSAPTNITVTVYDALGRRVTELFRGQATAGEHTVEWNPADGGQNVTSGLYFYRIASENAVATGRMVKVE